MYKNAVRLSAWFILAGLLLAAPLVAAAPQGSPAGGRLAPFDPYILEVIAAEGKASFYAVLRVQADLSGAADLATREAKGQYVFDRLTRVAAETQGPLLQALAAEGAVYRPYWIRNMVRVTGDKALLMALAARPDVAEIVYEYPAIPEEGSAAGESGPDTIEWNIARVNADKAWSLGITGQGAVVADLDTGVQWDHPALKTHYRGCQNQDCTLVDHNYNWWDGPVGSHVPLDYGYHGTHTMGTIIGDDGGANQIGMAPGARWIACAGLGSMATPTDCFQFFLAPTKLDGSDPRPDLAPHVINNSWTSDTDYHAIIQTLYAAGIFYAKSAGNTGSGCGTITNPGQWPEVTAAGAFGQGDIIASFSSRGPVTIGHDQFVKPDIAAPGVNVRSSLPGNSYGLLSGTSMACPHVTGAVALLISANPELAGQIDVLQMILKQSAEPKIDAQCPPFVDHPNDVWGWGILDAQAAVNRALAMGLGEIAGTVTDSSSGEPVGGASIAFVDASGWPLSDTSADDGSYGRSLPADTYEVTTTRYGYLPQVDPGIVVVDGGVTVHDIALDPAPEWPVSGQVVETQTGDPLAAKIVFEETPVTARTDPATGLYSADVAQGTWWMNASSPGHASEARLVTVDHGLTEDFSLPAIWNYTLRSSHDMCDPVPFAWVDATGGAPLCLTDDASQYVGLPGGRSFSFYGNSYAGLYVGSNGIVTFGAPWSKWTGPIPNPASPNNGIYAFSQDLNPNSCAQGTVYTQYIDSRYFVIEYYQVQHYPSGNPETFEIILDLDTGLVVIQHLVVSDPTGVVVGVENSTGTEATQYAFDDPELITDETRAEFGPVFGTPPLMGPGEVEGVVSSAPGGEPLTGATVTALAWSSGEVTTYITGPDGSYAAVLCPGWYTLSAGAEGHLPSDPVDLEVLPGTETTLDFVLVRGYWAFLPLVVK